MIHSSSTVIPCRICVFCASFVILTLCAATPLLASRPYLVDQDVTARLERGASPGEKLILGGVPVIDGDPMELELERFEVWAPNAQILVYEADGQATHTLPRPASRYYKGHLQGDPESAVAITVEPDGKIEGTIFTKDRFFTIGRGIRHTSSRAGDPRHGDGALSIDHDAPLLVREFDPVEDLAANPEASGWSCGFDGIGLNALRQSMSISKMAPRMSAAAATHGITATGTPASGVSYGLVLGMETDGELWAAFGTDAAVTSYLGTLVAQASVIYQRDLKATLTIGTVHLWQNASTDPWTVQPASGTAAALAEFGTYWHANFSAVNRSSAVFISGKSFNGGIAWGDTLCQADLACGPAGTGCGGSTFANSYAGGYAFCGSTVVTTTVPDPTQTVNGVQYGLPANNNFWILLEVCHELGHNANGPHTHCIPLNSTQQAQYNVPGRTFVDLCFNGEGSTCFTGATSAPVEKGTIMSYCHNIFAGGFRQSRYLFYKAGEPNELEGPFFATGLNNATPGLDATITSGTNLACAAGQTASVPAGAATYSWQISGGSITGGQNTRQITFTPTAPSVTLTATAGNVNGCSIINSATTSTQCGLVLPPANVVATATSTTNVSVTWSLVSNATYTVLRSSNGTSYISVGTPATNSLNDTSVSPNTAYLYKVTATSGSVTSGDSNRDLATTITFTDPTLIAGSTMIKVAHLTELRNAVAAVRTLAGLSNPNFTDTNPAAGSTPGKRVHLTELRTNLDDARAALGLPSISYADAAIMAQSTLIKAVHVTDLRGGVR